MPGDRGEDRRRHGVGGGGHLGCGNSVGAWAPWGPATQYAWNGEGQTGGRVQLKLVAFGLHLLGVSMLISGIGVLVASGEPLFVVVPIGSSLVGVGSILFDYLTWRS